MQEELVRRNAAFRREGDCLYLDTSHAEQLSLAQEAVFGTPPPSGLSTGSTSPEEVIETLRQAGIEARVMVYADTGL